MTVKAAVNQITKFFIVYDFSVRKNPVFKKGESRAGCNKISLIFSQHMQNCENGRQIFEVH